MPNVEVSSFDQTGVGLAGGLAEPRTLPVGSKRKARILKPLNPEPQNIEPSRFFLQKSKYGVF
jgi:hypothetical protein